MLNLSFISIELEDWIFEVSHLSEQETVGEFRNYYSPEAFIIAKINVSGWLTPTTAVAFKNTYLLECITFPLLNETHYLIIYNDIC